MRSGSGSPLSDHFNRIPEYERAVVLGSTIDLVSIKDPERISLTFLSGACERSWPYICASFPREGELNHYDTPVIM